MYKCNNHPTFYTLFAQYAATTVIYTFPYTTLFRSAHSETGARGTGLRVVRRRDRARSVGGSALLEVRLVRGAVPVQIRFPLSGLDRKSTRLNSSHVKISYAVFCLKKKKECTIEGFM